MSESYTFFSQDVSACNEMEAWWNMINCIVNFVNASTNLATNLDGNHLNNARSGIKVPEGLPKPADGALVAANISDNKDQLRRTEDTVKRSDDMCLTDFPHFVDELAEKDKPSDTNAPDVSITNPPENPPIPKTLQENLTEPQATSQSATIVNPQDKGDYNKPEIETSLVVQPTEESDEGIDISHVQQSESESKANNSISEGKIEAGKTKTPSDDSCFFQEYSDSEQSLNSSDIGSAFDEQISEIEKTVKENIVTKQDNVGKTSENKPTKQQIEEIKQILLSEGAITKETEEQEDNESKDVDKVLDVNKSQEIQTNSTSRYKRTVRALITQSPELQKPIMDDIRIKKIKEKSPIHENAPRAVPESLNELKEQLDSIKNKPNTASASSKRDTLTPEKQIVDLTKCLKRCQIKNKTGKKIGPPEQYLKAPRSSVINIKKEIIAEKNTVKGNGPKKLPKVTKRYDSIESVVKKMIQGLPKTTEHVLREQNTQKSPNEMRVSNKRQQGSHNSEENKEESIKLTLGQGTRNRSSSRSSAGSRGIPHKDVKKEPASNKSVEKLTILHPKSKNVLKNEPTMNPLGLRGMPRSRTPVKINKNLKVTTEGKKKIVKRGNHVTEEKKSLSAKKTSATKLTAKPKSAI